MCLLPQSIMTISIIMQHTARSLCQRMDQAGTHPFPHYPSSCEAFLTRILPTTPNAMHWCKCLLQIPVGKALRAYNILIKIPFIGHNTKKGIALGNPTSLQMLQTPSCTASDRYLIRPQHAAQTPFMLMFVSIVVLGDFIGFS